MALLQVIATTLTPVFGVVFLGFFVARRKVMPLGAASGLNQFVYWVSLPAMMFNLLIRLDSSMVSMNFLAGFFAALLISYVLCFAITSDFFQNNKSNAVMFSCMAGFPNVVFMGVPMVTFLLPGNEAALAIAGLCAFLYTLVMLYTDTVLEMRCHCGENPGKYLLSLLKTFMRSPMIIACVCGFIFSGASLPVPEFIRNITAMLGGTASPCALFAMGMIMSAQVSGLEKLPHEKFSRRALRNHLTVHLGKLLILPVLIFISLWLFGIRGIELGVTTLFSGMPIAVASLALAEKFQICVEESSIIIPINTIASILSIPIIIAALYALNVFS